ncbi:TetR/AcrR family transcriptional regulator [Bacillus sp. JCM 19034]|uniref:TetR/AcrR family transcriptional regulator n=1 Tax=Bacillus sp. JCM 19034 TaxID=1481928 RepID=UPI000783ADB1|nr:TetR/AcrR family transcriptional regulator [Bacillus sp. JCM 19034]
MPRDAQKNKEIRDTRIEQILHSAAKVFARKGMTATKISEIAKEAKLSHGLVYHYFRSKEEIFSRLVKTASERSLDIVHKATQYNGTSLEKIKWMTEKILESIESGDGTYLFLIMIQASTSDAVPDEVREILKGDHSNTPISVIVPIIIAGQNEGEIVGDDPVKLAVSYYAFIQGLAINKIQWKECPMPDADMITKILRNREGQ